MSQNIKPKNRIICPECNRSKIIFESEAKAQRFIEFNKDAMKHGDKLRVYYCEACGGWHVTHHRYSTKYKNRTDKLIAAYERDSGAKETLRELNKKIGHKAKHR